MEEEFVERGRRKKKKTFSSKGIFIFLWKVKVINENLTFSIQNLFSLNYLDSSFNDKILEEGIWIQEAVLVVYYCTARRRYILGTSNNSPKVLALQ